MVTNIRAMSPRPSPPRQASRGTRGTREPGHSRQEHPPVPQDLRDDVLPHHRDEDEDAPGDQPGQRDRECDLAEGRPAASTEILRRLDERPVHPSSVTYRGKTISGDNRRRARSHPRRSAKDAEALVPDEVADPATQHARAEDDEPRIRSDEEARPERDDQEQDQQALALTGTGGDEIGERNRRTG